RAVSSEPVAPQKAYALLIRPVPSLTTAPPPRGGAVDRDDEIAREREQRDRLRGGVGPEEHHRVGTGGHPGSVACAVVVTDHEGDRGLVGVLDHVQALLRALAAHGLAPKRSRALVCPEIETAHEPRGEHS